MKIEIKLLSLMTAVMTLGIVAYSAQAINSEKMNDKIESKKAAIDEKKSEKMCNRIDNMLSRLENKIGGEKTQLKERIENRTREMKENRTSRDTELENRRMMRNENRESFYKELEDQSGDDATKKAAVSEFKSTVEAAIETRRKAIDQARETMNKGIDSAIGARNSEMEALRVEFKKELEATVNKAGNSCTDSTTAEELKNTMDKLKGEIKTIRERNRLKVNSTKKVQETIQTLRDERKEAVKIAIENFKATMKTAQEKFRTAMGE